MSKPTIFISYSHRDERWKERLVTHLGVLQIQNHLDFWTDDEIGIGDAWFQKIQDAMNTASVAIFLVSADSLTSNFILREEIKRLLERREKEQLPIFPILVRPCAWESVPWLARMQIRPKRGVPLSAGNEYQIEENLTAIVREIKTISEKVEVKATDRTSTADVSSVPDGAERETGLPPPPDPPSPSFPRPKTLDLLSRLLPLCQIVVKDTWRWLSWFSLLCIRFVRDARQSLSSLPRVRGTLALSVSSITALFVLTYLLPIGDKAMVAVSSGEFWMGCNEKIDTECDGDEKPGRKVYIDAFSIDKYEVTVADYRRCVEAETCTDEGLTSFGSCNWGEKDKDNHPINCVDWDQAQTYCRWANKRLPTEAEWEKVARGTDERVYPWGNEWGAKRVNVGSGGTSVVGSHTTGVSPYGAYDMAGNVWEWVQDWYDKDYYKRYRQYKQDVEQNRQGPNSGTFRVVRGGSWFSGARFLRVSLRVGRDPGNRDVLVGFRCAG